MRLKTKNTTGVLIFAALMVLTGGFLLSASQVFAATGVNKQINFQGKVVNADGTNVANGSYDFVFKLYSVDTAGTAIWTETRTGGNQVTVTDGVFQVNLGEVTALPGSVDFNTDNIYLGVTFHTDSEMTPRVRFTAVPYAFNADKVHGLTVTDTTGTLTIANGKTVSFADAFTTTGAFPLTLTATASTTATLPTGTITLADLTTGQTFTNKAIGSTGLTFSGAATDITTASGEDLVIVANGVGIVDIQDGLQVNSLNVDTGNVTIAGGSSYTGAGSVTLSSGGSSGLTIDSASGVTTMATGDYLALSRSGVSGAAAGYFWYDSSDNKFKINENGTTKTLCNTTDGSCGGGGMTIGGSITSSTPGSVLFVGSSNDLQQDNVNFFWDNTNKRLGLGDNTPDAILDINLTSTSSTAGTGYGNTVTVSDTGVVTTGSDTTYGDYLSVTRTGATGGTINTYGSYATVTGTVANVAATAGTYGQYLSVSGGVTGTTTTYGSYVAASGGDLVYGSYQEGRLDASGVALYGSYSKAMTGGTGSASSIFGVYGDVEINGGSNSDAYGLYSSVSLNSGSIATGYGLFIADVAGTTDYGVYQFGSSDDNYFAGYVGIGDNTPDNPLEITSTSTQIRLSYTDGSVDGTIGVDSNEYLSLQAGTTGEIKRIQIGAGGAGSTTPDFFGLDVKSDSGDPVGGFEGAMYYNTSDNKFRCYQNTGWTDCIATGGGVTWDAIGDAAAAGAIAMNEYAQTMDWNTASTAAAFDGLTITLTNDATTDSNTQRAMVVANQNDGASTGTTEAIMAVVNRDTDETVGSGLVVENTGTGTMTNAIAILETAGTITTAINIGNGVTTGISIGTGVTTGISIASGGITSTGEVLFTNTGTGLSLRVNDEAADTTPMVVDAAGNVGIGTAAPNRILDIVQAASAPQLRLSKDLTYYSEFTVDSVGDLQVAAVGGDIRALSENVWVCDNDACPALTLTGEGNIFVENVLKFGNGVYIKNDSATELSVYDNDDQAMLIFDEL